MPYDHIKYVSISSTYVKSTLVNQLHLPKQFRFFMGLPSPEKGQLFFQSCHPTY